MGKACLALESKYDDVSQVYEELSRVCSPELDVRRELDAGATVTADVICKVKGRLKSTERLETGSSHTHRSRMSNGSRQSCHETAKSRFGSMDQLEVRSAYSGCSKTSHGARRLRQESCGSVRSMQTRSSQRSNASLTSSKRIDTAAEVAAHQAELESLQEEDRRRTELLRLEAEERLSLKKGNALRLPKNMAQAKMRIYEEAELGFENCQQEPSERHGSRAGLHCSYSPGDM